MNPVPQTFRKRPVTISAMQLTRDNAPQVAEWCGAASWVVVNTTLSPTPAVDVNIRTLEGTMTAHEGDWIIQGVQGEFYPVKPDIFLATYEPA